MLRLAILTTGRQDWGALRSIASTLRSDPRFEVVLLAGGMALAREFGRSVDLMREDGLAPDAELDWLSATASVNEASRSAAEAGAATTMIGDALARCRPDALLLLGDRFETLSAAQAATLARIAIVHLHGGEETEGAFDNAIRHAITKLAHLHLVSHEEHRRRVVALGEDPRTVHVVGAPGLDNLRRPDLPDRAAVESRVGIPLVGPVVVVTLHPATLGGDPLAEARALTSAMGEVEATYVVTLPNNDPGAAAVRAELLRACASPRRVAVEALGERYYWGLMRVADAMLGNSSSGIVEAPALGLPVVNVGARQRGRLRAPNVIDVEHGDDPSSIANALRKALVPSFRDAIGDASRATFGDGHAAAEVVRILATWSPPRPPLKALVEVSK